MPCSELWTELAHSMLRRIRKEESPRRDGPRLRSRPCLQDFDALSRPPRPDTGAASELNPRPHGQRCRRPVHEVFCGVNTPLHFPKSSDIYSINSMLHRRPVLQTARGPRPSIGGDALVVIAETRPTAAARRSEGKRFVRVNLRRSMSECRPNFRPWMLFAICPAITDGGPCL
jgi:hypothetical protein